MVTKAKVGKFTRKCPKCGADLELKSKRRGGFQVGCAVCPHREPLPEGVRMRLLGAPPLPGFPNGNGHSKKPRARKARSRRL